MFLAVAFIERDNRSPRRQPLVLCSEQLLKIIKNSFGLGPTRASYQSQLEAVDENDEMTLLFWCLAGLFAFYHG